ncbi:MAG: hypothetical protein WDM87_16200 [Terracidiphilus sp.]
MRAGAREFLTFPFAPDKIDEAMTRVAIRISASPTPKKISGKILVFVGAKGGAGVTTVASNYAVALAQDTTRNTLLIDFDLPLGDAAMGFGLSYEFSTVDALRDAERLDPAFLSKLVVRHSSGSIAPCGSRPVSAGPHRRCLPPTGCSLWPATPSITWLSMPDLDSIGRAPISSILRRESTS